MEPIYLFVAAIVAIPLLILNLVQRRLAYWSKRGVPQSKPHFLYGDFRGVGKTRHISEPLHRAYESSKNLSPFAGVYVMLTPVAVVTDLELVKNILTKDFANFADRGLFCNERDDPLSAHLFNLEGSKWRKMRQNLSPTFTSGKMKFMFPTVVNVASELINCVESTMDQSSCIEIKDILSRFTTDIIGICAFGIECNSLRDPNATIRLMGKKAIFEKNHSALLESFMLAVPRIAKFLRMRRTSTNVHNYFLRIVREVVDYRESNKIRRNDFMNLLLDLKNNQNDGKGQPTLSIEEIAAQAFVFFFAGFEPSSNAIAFCLYELAQNQLIQDRLRCEILNTIHNYDNKFSYQCMRDMTYLNMVLCETLRKYPSLPHLIRLASSDYKVPKTSFVIEKGTKVFIPVLEIQHDPEIYPHPETFDPERFSPREVKGRHPSAWLPFGDGPRNCIGLRFGKMQSCIALVFLLKSYRFTVCSQTDIPLKFGKKRSAIYTDGGIVLEVEKV